MASAALLLCCLLAVASGQQIGTQKPETHPEISFATCTKSGGCTSEQKTLTMDSQWRWLHDARKNQYKNCIKGTPPTWDESLCPDGLTCAGACALEGMNSQEYKGTYGVSTVSNGIRLKFKNGESIGSRLYMMEDENTYMMFKLLNREFTLDVDVSTLECGLNGAVYFVEMKADGGLGEGNNEAGAKYGTGYCDAQCPHDLKFISGEANLEDWTEKKTGPVGRYGACCAEMDIWEANAHATAYTTHACDADGLLRCEGTGGDNQCGDTPEDCECCLEEDCECCGRYKGNCDKDGCDFNPFRLGDQKFYGKGSDFAVDTTKPMTVVTQFLTTDGTDTGDLKEIRRLYVQDGKVIQNSKVSNIPALGGEGPDADSITDEMCTAQKEAFGDPDDFTEKGSVKGMGKALGRGMVLVLSLWDDMLTHMHWLDSAAPLDHPDTHPLSKPGVKRGPCSPEAGDPLKLRQEHPDAYVVFSNIKVGEIDSTYGSSSQDHGSGEGSNGADSHTEDNSNADTTSTTEKTGNGDSNEGSGSNTEVVDASTLAECCTASIPGGHPCEFCYTGAALSQGHWCTGSEDRCSNNCGGTWCPNGAKKHFRLFEDDLGPVGSPSARLPMAAGAAMGAAAVLAAAGLIASARWCAWPQRARSAGSVPLTYEHVEGAA